MKYLSFDIEATGLDEKDLIIEFGMIPFDAEKRTLCDSLQKHFYIKCPRFDQLKPKLNQWVIENNKYLIDKANSQGVELTYFKQELTKYFESKEVREYFNNQKIILFGKSMNAIDLPFLNRDLGWNFMRKYFSHRVNDLSSFAYNLIDMKKLPPEAESGSWLMQHLKMGNVAHTALEDAINTAKMYLTLLERLDGEKTN